MHIEEDVRKVGPTGNKEIITRRLVPKKVEFKGGYMVYFPQGHSIFVPEHDKEQLHRLGVLRNPAYVDMESGEVVPENYNLSPKEIVERKEANRPRSPYTGSQMEDAVDA